MTGSDPRLVRARALLDLGPESSRREVVQAFRRRARAVHPDVSTAADAAERFAELSGAYRLALAHVDDGHRVLVGSAPSPAVAADRPAGGTSPLVWVGPAVVVSESWPPRPRRRRGWLSG